MMKKNTRISNVSRSSGKADKSATIRTLKPLILEIAFSGRRTLNTLKLAGLNPASSYSTALTGYPFFSATAGPESSSGPATLAQLMMTMIISRQFQGSLI